MKWEDYLYYFEHTCISIDFGDKYFRKSIVYDGNKTLKESEQVKFYLTVDETINCTNTPISVEVI
jgi:hypothetical protein